MVSSVGYKLSGGSRREELAERGCQYPLSGSSASLGISLAPGVFICLPDSWLLFCWIKSALCFGYFKKKSFVYVSMFNVCGFGILVGKDCWYDSYDKSAQMNISLHIV